MKPIKSSHIVGIVLGILFLLTSFAELKNYLRKIFIKK